MGYRDPLVDIKTLSPVISIGNVAASMTEAEKAELKGGVVAEGGKLIPIQGLTLADTTAAFKALGQAMSKAGDELNKTLGKAGILPTSIADIDTLCESVKLPEARWKDGELMIAPEPVTVPGWLWGWDKVRLVSHDVRPFNNEILLSVQFESGPGIEPPYYGVIEFYHSSAMGLGGGIFADPNAIELKLLDRDFVKQWAKSFQVQQAVKLSGPYPGYAAIPLRDELQVAAHVPNAMHADSTGQFLDHEIVYNDETNQPTPGQAEIANPFTAPEPDNPATWPPADPDFEEVEEAAIAKHLPHLLVPKRTVRMDEIDQPPDPPKPLQRKYQRKPD